MCNLFTRLHLYQVPTVLFGKANHMDNPNSKNGEIDSSYGQRVKKKKNGSYCFSTYDHHIIPVSSRKRN